MKIYHSPYGKEELSDLMTTKHEKILIYIETLPIGNKLSVRSIAKEMNVSEGTAYRAIKNAEEKGIVTTIERVGTIRTKNSNSKNIEKLTFKEIVKVTDGEILGGEKGINKSLNRFFIGAMEEQAMLRYVSSNSLMIIGNRENAQKLSLQHGAAILITGGFEPSKEVIKLANELKLPVISSSYDTFTIASMINRSLSDQLIKKEILLVDNIYTCIEDTDHLIVGSTVYDYKVIEKQHGHSRFPVVNSQNRVVGIVTARDIIGKDNMVTIESIMTKNPNVAKTYNSVASIAHSMIWDGYELLPVVEDDLTLKGIISRQDIMKALQSQSRQPHMKDTISDQIKELVQDVGNGEHAFTVTPQMTNSLGTISYGVLAELVTEVSQSILSAKTKRNISIDQLQLHYFKLIPIESEILIKAKVFDQSRRAARMDVEIVSEEGIVAKALLSCQFIVK